MKIILFSFSFDVRAEPSSSSSLTFSPLPRLLREEGKGRADTPGRRESVGVAGEGRGGGAGTEDGGALTSLLLIQVTSL